MRIALLVGLVLAAVLGTSPAHAGDKAGVRMADSIQVDGTQVWLNGMGLREATWLKINVYVAGLYVEHLSSDPASLVEARETKVLVLHFVRDVGRKDILKAWHDGFRGNATIPLPAIQREMDQLDKMTPKFSKGDTLTFVYVPDVGVTVSVNNLRRGTLKGEQFARSLFSIWLGRNPPTKALKRGLLGNHGAST